MWRVRTGSRLHLGLLSLPASSEVWPDRLGQPRFPARRFGGVGLVIDAPGLALRATPASTWNATGPLAERALAYARLAQVAVGSAQAVPCHLHIDHAPREHVGLGTGTQLGLAVARVLAATWGLTPSAAELAAWVRRGRRSALGVHGFEQGGFLVEAGKTADQALSPLVARLAFPPAWRVLLAIPTDEVGRHGSGEQAAFDRLAGSLDRFESLCRLVLLGILPALVEADLPAFGEALHDFNARVGELFATEQGGIYASPFTTDLVAHLRQQGVAGVGQSSWGPGVFAVLPDQDQAAAFARRLEQIYPVQTWVTRGRNQGATLDRC
ncbi:MAG: beta-ribofuranosylaminobenzene 5'-phosphate synthase family protein [Gemmataceae bacterium]